MERARRSVPNRGRMTARLALEADLDERANQVISTILRSGVYVSAAILLIGLALLLIAPSHNRAGVLDLSRNAVVLPAVPTSVGAISRGIREGDASSIVQLGVLVLLATPVIRVAASIVLFVIRGDRLYVVVTSVVLVLLLVSIFVLGALRLG